LRAAAWDVWKECALTIRPLIRPTVRHTLVDLEPYHPVSSMDDIRLLELEEPLKLDWNESTVPPSPRVVERIQEFLGNHHHLNWYPDLFSRRLTGRLAAFNRLSEDQLIVTNGSDDALELVCKTYLDEGEEVLVPRPTYAHFLVFAREQGGKVVSVQSRSPFQKNLDDLLAGLTPATKVIYLVSPNNPTGVTFEEEEVEEIARRAPQAIVIVDEAYHEFYGRTCAGLVTRLPNVVVTRTFSKAYGLAGLRVGYAMASRDVIRNFKKIHNPKGVNVIAQLAAETALEDQAHVERFVADVTEGKRILGAAFDALGVEYHLTPANFVNVRVDRPQAFCDALARRHVWVRNRETLPGMSGFVRITVGTPGQMQELLGHVRAALAELSTPALGLKAGDSATDHAASSARQSRP
jgi:histidinol-phosphate aminotransferase